MPSYALLSEIGNKSESKFPTIFPQPPFQVLQNSHEVLPKTFYEIEIRETNNYQLLRNFEEIEFETKWPLVFWGVILRSKDLNLQGSYPSHLTLFCLSALIRAEKQLSEKIWREVAREG